MKAKQQKYTLGVTERGLRTVHLHTPGASCGIFGIIVRAGSRDEAVEDYGLAHFVEHTIFKGTARRSSWHIINRMEAVGGELNAYTTKEETVVYTIFPNGSAPRAIELVADLVMNSRFPERELTKEKEVVADEIDSYLDTPSEAVFDDFEEILFEGHPLAHNILGKRENLKNFTGARCLDYLKKFYTAPNAVAFYSGAQGPERIAELIDRHFQEMSTEARPTVVCSERGFSCNGPVIRHREIESHQSHTVMGIRAGGIFDSGRYAIALLSNIAGGPGMNSLLNIALREKRGLVYSVESSTSMFTDCGMMSVYYGCDPDDNSRCMDLCRKVYADIASGAGLTPRRLNQAKKQYLGQMLVASENKENTILSAARSTLFHGSPNSAADIQRAIEAVDMDQIRALAGAMSEPCVLTLGPR